MMEEAARHKVPKLQQLSKPFLTPDDATSLLRRLFGLIVRASQIEEFSSYDDRTYHVRTEPDRGIGEQTEFILKVLNSEFTAEGAVGTQTDILVHLQQSSPGLKCQSPVRNLNGQFVSFESISNDCLTGESIGRVNTVSAVRLFGFLPGRPLVKLAPLPPQFFLQVGQHLGDLQNALQGYPNDVEPLQRKASQYIWCLENVSQLRHYLHVVEDVKALEIVNEVITEFERKVIPVFSELRKGILHHDFSDCNVLAAHPLSETDDGWDKKDCEISGVIDFDEMVYSCLVFDIAVAMMYFTFCSDEPLAATAYLLAGYEARAPLPEKERAVLRVLIAGRFIQSLVLGLYSSSLNPDNPYIRQTQTKGWNLLGVFWNHPEDDLMKLWQDIKCKSGRMVTESATLT